MRDAALAVHGHAEAVGGLDRGWGLLCGPCAHERFGDEDFPVRGASAARDHLEELDHVLRRGEESAARFGVFAYVQVGVDKLADGLLGTGRLVCGELVDGGAAGGLLGRGDERRVRHAERLEDALPHFHVERTSRHLFRDGRRHVDVPVAVDVLRAWLVCERLLCGTFGEGFHAGTRQIGFREAGEAGGVAEQHAQGGAVRGGEVLPGGEVLLHGVVERKFAFGGKVQHERAEDAFRVGGHPEDRIRLHPPSGRGLSHALETRRAIGVRRDEHRPWHALGRSAVGDVARRRAGETSLVPGRLERRALLGRAGHRDAEHPYHFSRGIERRVRAVGTAVPHTIRFDVQAKSVGRDLGTIRRLPPRHFPHRLLGKDATPVRCRAASRQHSEEAAQVVRRAEQPAAALGLARGIRVRIAELGDLDFPGLQVVREPVGLGEARHLLLRRHECRVLHAKRIEDALLHHGRKGTPRHLLHNGHRHVDTPVGVGVALARIGRQRRDRREMRQLGDRPLVDGHSGEERQSAHVRERHPHRHRADRRARTVLRRHLHVGECGQILRHEIVQVHLPLVHQRHQCGGGDRLRVGGQPEERVGPHRRFRLKVCVAAAVDGRLPLRVHHDRHRARQLSAVDVRPDGVAHRRSIRHSTAQNHANLGKAVQSYHSCFSCCHGFLPFSGCFKIQPPRNRTRKL